MHYLRMFAALAVSIFLTANASLSLAADAERPSRLDAAVIVLEATVAAVDHETREVTLQGSDGRTVTITADEDVKNLDQVDVGDKVSVEYLEMVALEALPSNEVELAAMTTAANKTEAMGEKPASAVVQETQVITVIEAIDKETEMVTLKGPDGNSTTVKARNPANLEKIAVGDKVLITHTTAVAVSVTETEK
jgi:predicted RecA/RadA family phage recombinase